MTSKKLGVLVGLLLFIPAFADAQLDLQRVIREAQEADPCSDARANRRPFSHVIHQAVVTNAISCVKVLIAQGVDVDAWDADGNTPLHLAAKSARGTAIIGALLDAGADLDISNNSYETPLEVAEANENIGAAHTIRRWLQRRQAERVRQAGEARLAHQQRQEELDREAAAQERELELLRLQLAIAQLQAATNVEPGPRTDATTLAAPSPAGPGCLIPGYPDPPNLNSLGFAWCPGDVDFQIRAYALQAAGAWCSIDGRTSANPQLIATRHAEINEACDRAAVLGATLGDTRCDCNLDPRVRP